MMKKFLSRLKALVFRYYYRFINAKVWRDVSSGQGVLSSTLILPIDNQPIRARMYHGREDHPIIIYFHGGGWVIGDLDTHDPFCRSLVEATHCTLMSIDYRLAPEHPFPAAHEDSFQATRWILDNLNTLAPNNGRAVIAGDSAGGNLAACTLASMPDEPRLVGSILLYPATEHYLHGFPSFSEHARSKPLTASIMRWFVDTYMGGITPADPTAKQVFLNRRTDYRNFPRSLIVTAERDVLRDDGRRLSILMRQASVDVTYQHYDDEAHGFACSEGPTPGHQHFISLANKWLNYFSTKP
jgi:acetyl esterase